ncbi:hypothetical protein KTE11_28450 [Burkholderia multivorans]|uniref:antitoxin VbhA family protein n=1 Tax=Burkholderia multivorans TaxID=87883 RepID=UPI001C2633CC|nr:antitoxin VbhA family protein [Burkholderia multivorans]MBU9348632.1 hypothetical protein [Burkholderia multivorans]
MNELDAAIERGLADIDAGLEDVADELDRKYRLAAVENAIATQRLEGLELDPRTIAELEQVAAGELDVSEVLRRVHERIKAGEFKSPPADD